MLRTSRAFVLVAATFVGGLAAGSSVVHTAAAPYASLDTLARALSTIEDHHLAPPGADALLYGAISGMVDTLDPHSTFLAPADADALQDRAEGRFMGVGIALLDTDAGVVVGRVVPGSPAALSDIRVGDQLLSVDGALTQTAEGAAALLPGARGTPVVLVLDRDGVLLEPTVVRDEVLEIGVAGALFEPGWGYVRVDRFYRRVTEDTQRALAELEAAGGPLRGLVIDLRGNPGGLLEEAVAMVDLFLDRGVIVETRGRDGRVLETHSATEDPPARIEDLVVLIDGGSASASEIFAGTLQARRRARLVGSATYGKGSVQKVYRFEDGAALKLTIARYHVAGDAPLPPEGITPDVQINPDQDISGEVTALRSAVLSRSLPEPDRTRLIGHLSDLDAALSATPAVSDDLAQRMKGDRALRESWALVRSP